MRPRWSFLKNWQFWRSVTGNAAQDRLLREIIKNSSYLFSSNTIAMILSMLQGIFAARLLSVEGFGILTGAVIPFVSNVNRLLSFRMSELVVKYLGEYLAPDHTSSEAAAEQGPHHKSGKTTDNQGLAAPGMGRQRAGALVKAVGLVEILTSVLAFGLLVLAAPFAARYIVKQTWTQSLFVLYGLVLLSNLCFETATGVLQSVRKFNYLSQINLAQSLVTAGLIFWAFLRQGEILDVLLAYLIGKSVASLALYWLAWRTLNEELGRDWWRAALSLLPPRRELIHFALNTNLQGTINLIVRDSEALLIIWLRNPVESGYFKIAQGVINLVMLPIEPFIATTYAEIARTIGQRQYLLTRRLLKRVSAIAGAWTLAAGGGLALLGWWLIPFLYGQDYLPAYPAALALLVGYGFANILNWNRPLLLALNKPGYPLAVSALAGLVKTGLTFMFTPIGGYVVEGAILSAYFVASVSTIVWRGMRELAQRAAQMVEVTAPT